MRRDVFDAIIAEFDRSERMVLQVSQVSELLVLCEEWLQRSIRVRNPIRQFHLTSFRWRCCVNLRSAAESPTEFEAAAPLRLMRSCSRSTVLPQGCKIRG